jgi:O-antigen/teichoic acid export membrane protein
MKSAPRRLAANAGLALAGDALAKAGMFLALVVLARGIQVREFAHLAVAMAAMVIVTTVIDGGVSVIATREGAAQPLRRASLLRAGVGARVPLIAAAAAITLVAGGVVGQVGLAAVVLLAAIVNATQIALFAVFRGGQTLVQEAVAKGACGASYPVLCAAALVTGHRSASSAMLAMTVGPAVTLPPLLVATRAAMRASGFTVRPLMLLRESAPFGLMAIATLVYYRAPMLMIGLLSTPSQTAAYSVASNIAFGLLMLPAALATALLPRLAGEADAARRQRVVRKALFWNSTILGIVACVVAGTAWWLIPLVFGRQYANATGPLLILLASGLAIGAAGIVGTALVAAHRKRAVALQVCAALAVNILADAGLIPLLGANGAALSTLLTEIASLVILFASYGRDSAPRAFSAAPPSPVSDPALVL